jgi:hypothetical protein
MRVVAFAGPSRPTAGGRLKSVKIEWQGPARRDDLDRLEVGAGDLVLLLDGFVVQRYAPSPTECARLIRRGATLWGASSIGAIRAVELEPLGMRGHGWIYARIRDRGITWDDELVAMLDPRTHQATTVFLANIRYGLERAVHRGLVSGDLAGRVLDQLRAVHFADRSLEVVTSVLSRLGLPLPLRESLVGPDADIKRIDAAGLVRRVARVIGRPW